MIRCKLFRYADAAARFPEAIAAMRAHDEEMEGEPMSDGKWARYVRDLIFWTDPRGWLHVDDRVHPAYDDEWDPERREWLGSSLCPYDGEDVEPGEVWYEDDWAIQLGDEPEDERLK